MKPSITFQAGAAFVPTILAFLLAQPVDAGAQAQSRVPAPLPPSLDIKTPAEPSVQTFPSERASRPHPAAVQPGDRSTIPPDAVNRDPAAWAPNQPDPSVVLNAKRQLDPRLPADRVRPIDHSVMHYTTQHGTVWARGEHYKVSFDAAGVTYFPALGRHQAHNVPHALSPDAVSVGGEALDFERAAPAVRDGERVHIDRGAFTEAYELTPQSLEQTFVFSSMPRSGDLVVHIPMASEFEARETEDGLEFRGELGRVTYGRATVIDADGRRAAAMTTLENGSVSIRVDASFVAGATLPLVIDPVVSTFPIDVSSLDEYWPDAAYDGTAHTWCVVYEEWFSATDRDAYFALLDDAGTGASGFVLDLSSDSFDSLHVANNAGSNQFMIVSSVTSGNQVYVLASTIHSNGQPGTQTVVTGTEYGTIRNCVIGGDPYTGGAGPSYYCIVYERQYSSTDWDIVCRLINAAGTLVGSGPIYFSNSSGTIDVGPAISKSDGTHDWMIVWQRNNGYVNDADVWGGILHWDGTTFAPPFQISAWFQPEWQVAVSSPLNGSMRYLATWQDTDGGDHDIIMALLDGATKLDQQDMSIDDQFNYTLDQIESSVDSDGDQFLVAYSELYSWPDYDTYATDVYVSANNTLALAQRHVNLDYDTTKDHSSRVVGCYMNGNVTNPALHHRFLVAWNSSPNPNGPADVKGAFFDNFDAGQATSYCFGDGTGAACPCGNTGFTGHGCENSSGTGGGLLIASGIASLANDTLLFTTQNEKPSALSTVSQGDAQISPTPFGQGLRCAGGHLKRLYSKTSFNGSITAPGFGDPSVHARSAQLGDTILAGSVRYYYVYYRDAIVLGGCSPGATFNNTQSVAVTWAP